MSEEDRRPLWKRYLLAVSITGAVFWAVLLSLAATSGRPWSTIAVPGAIWTAGTLCLLATTFARDAMYRRRRR